MARVLLLVDPAVGVSPTEVVKAWSADPPVVDGAPGTGPAVEALRGRVFMPGVLELVVLPVAVNLASAALLELALSLVRRARPPAEDDGDLEVVESTDEEGNRLLVVRRRRGA